MAVCFSSLPLPVKRIEPNSISFSSSLPFLKFTQISSQNGPSLGKNKGGFFKVEAAWTRRSRGELAKRPNKKSWKQKTDMYMRPFLLNVFFSNRFIHAKVMHRGTSKVVSVATTNSKDLRNALPSLTDDNACRVIGKIIAERSKEADVYAIAFELKKNERVEGRLAIVLDTIQENDFSLAHTTPHHTGERERMASALKSSILRHMRLPITQSIYAPRASRAAAIRFMSSSHGDDHLDRQEVVDRVLEVVKSFPKVDPQKVTPDVHFQKDLGLDSLDGVEIVMALEEEFKLEIPDKEADKIDSCPLAVEYIYNHPMSS